MQFIYNVLERLNCIGTTQTGQLTIAFLKSVSFCRVFPVAYHQFIGIYPKSTRSGRSSLFDKNFHQEFMNAPRVRCSYLSMIPITRQFAMSCCLGSIYVRNEFFPSPAARHQLRAHPYRLNAGAFDPNRPWQTNI